MAKTRRRPTTRSTRKQHRLARPGLWLATLSTVVGIATGMFTLRDQVLPRESGTALAVPDYQRAIGRICDDLNASDRSRALDARRLGPRLRHARTTLQQRDALLDSTRRSLARANHDLSLLRGLAVPASLAAPHRATVAAWSRNAERVLAYAQRLDDAGTRTQLVAAIDALARDRLALARDGVTLSAGLVRLGGGDCDLDPPKVTRTITLPGTRRHDPTPPSSRKAAPRRKVGPTPSPAAPLAGAAARHGPTTSHSVTPTLTEPHAVNPPNQSGGGAITGGGEG